MNIYITGIYGMLGWSLQRIFKEYHNIFGCDIVKNPYKKIDILKKEVIEKDILMNNTDIIIHCAGMINVNECEENKDICRKLNYDATKIITDIAKKNSIKLIYISTSMVFNGGDGCYNENDIFIPINEYAKNKVLSENYIIENLDDYLILRVNVLGWNVQKYKISFAEWMQNSLLKGEKIEIWDNVYYNYIFTEDLARVINKILLEKGIYHIGSYDYFSKYEICIKFAKLFGYNYNFIYPGECKDVIRPKKLILNIEKINKIVLMPSILDTLRELKANISYYKN